VHKLIRWLEQGAMAVAVVCVASIMLVVSVDAIGRYLFKAPLPVTFELVTFYLLITAVYMALAATYRQGDHINIDLLLARMSPRWRAGFDIVCSLLAAAVFALIAYGTLQHTIDAYRGREFIPGIIVWPMWLSYLPIPLGAALLVARLLHHSATLARQGTDPHIHVHTPEVVE
jgi:TRAP-type C4-dicarboxylate transport system permease small subunit